eukprot:6194414-Pleurochrysis_carterae.AAC.3
MEPSPVIRFSAGCLRWLYALYHYLVAIREGYDDAFTSLADLGSGPMRSGVHGIPVLDSLGCTATFIKYSAFDINLVDAMYGADNRFFSPHCPYQRVPATLFHIHTMDIHSIISPRIELSFRDSSHIT